MQIKPKYGVNLRLPSNEISDQWALMQNADMANDGTYKQIKGSVRFHGETIGTGEPTAIFPSYNNEANTADVLVAVDDKIMKKNKGTNEFEELFSGLEPGKVESAVEIDNKLYIAHPDHGIYEYDGIGQVVLVTSEVKLKDIIYSKETNRCFGISADITNAIYYTDDLATMGGVPLVWNPLNVDKIAPTKGDIIEKLDILRGRLIVAMTNSFWIYYINGSPVSWRPQKAPTVVGLASKKTWRQVGEEFWFLGFSTDTQLGVYAFNGDTSRLLSFDAEGFFKDVNRQHLNKACAELVDDIYKISVPYDRSSVNNVTMHVDTIKQNPNTNLPNFYGPHTYGFSCSAVLNNRKFKGEHLFGTKYTDGARIFKVDNYRTQHSEQGQDNGDLIPFMLVSLTIDRVTMGEEVLDEQWVKRFERMFIEYEPTGSWSLDVEIRKDYQTTIFEDLKLYLDESDLPLEGISLNNDQVYERSNGNKIMLPHILGEAIQIVLRNFNVNTTTTIKQIYLDARAVRRSKNAQVF